MGSSVQGYNAMMENQMDKRTEMKQNLGQSAGSSIMNYVTGCLG